MVDGQQFRRIYHYHLKKCGGTSLKNWLNRQVADDRTFDASALKLFNIKPMGGVFFNNVPMPDNIELLEASVGRSVFYWSDVVSSHAPLRRWAPDDALCVVMLRDPVDRLVSAVADWRRLKEWDASSAPPLGAAMVYDAASMPLRAYLEKHGRDNHVFDNYVVRALAAARLGFAVKTVKRAADLFDEAMQSLTEEFHVVGLTEQLGTSLNAVAELFGVAPEEHPPRLNDIQSKSRLEDEASQAKDILAELTAVDRPLYERARRVFLERHAAVGAAYDRDAFERLAASRAVQRLVGRRHNDATVFSVRDAIVGSGLHGRDDPGTSHCRVWSASAGRSLVYVPVPAGAPVALQLWVLGYSSEKQRNTLRVLVDGVPAEHRFLAQDGYRDLIEVPAKPVRSFAALEIAMADTPSNGVRGVDASGGDIRGVAFDRYGWRILAEAEL